MDTLSLRPWGPGDLPLLHRANAPAMTAHLNGSETEEQLVARHERYLRLNASGEARMFVVLAAEHPVGSIGYWRVRWRGHDALEAGWFVLPEAQGHRVAARALALLLDDARGHAGERRMLVAFPGVDNPASNAVCRRAGFELVGTTTETFREAELTVNEWVFDLDRVGEDA